MDLTNFYYPATSYTPDILAHRGTMTDLELANYVDKVYSYLVKMPPNRSVLLSSLCNPSTQELFVACIKLFIREVPKAGVSFSSDYQFIKKI